MGVPLGQTVPAPLRSLTPDKCNKALLETSGSQRDDLITGATTPLGQDEGEGGEVGEHRRREAAGLHSTSVICKGLAFLGLLAAPAWAESDGDTHWTQDLAMEGRLLPSLELARTPRHCWDPGLGQGLRAQPRESCRYPQLRARPLGKGASEQAGTLTAHGLCFPAASCYSRVEGEEQAGSLGSSTLSALPGGEGLGQESRQGVWRWLRRPRRGRETLSWLGNQGKIGFLFSPGWGCLS